MSTLAAPTFVARLRIPGYLVLGGALIFPFIDLYLSVMPLRPTTVVWRFGAVGLFSSAVGAPLLILFMIYVLALMLGDRKVTIAVTIIAALIAMTLVASAGAFALDALQMRARVGPQGQGRFFTVSGQAFTKLLVEGVVATVFAVSAYRTIRGQTRRESTRTERAPSLLVGRPGSTRPTPKLADGAAKPTDPAPQADDLPAAPSEEN